MPRDELLIAFLSDSFRMLSFGVLRAHSHTHTHTHNFCQASPLFKHYLCWKQWISAKERDLIFAYGVLDTDKSSNYPISLKYILSSGILTLGSWVRALCDICTLCMVF